MLFAVAAVVMSPPGMVFRQVTCCPLHAAMPALEHQDDQPAKPFDKWPDSQPVASRADEPNLSNIKQLTFGGQNAEAYWSADGQDIIFQSLQPGFPDEQIFTMKADGSQKRLVSTGLGRCTCSYFSPDKQHVYFSSTHERNPGPQVKLDMSLGYVWKVNPDFALYRAKADGTKLEPIIKKRGYVAETTISPDGSYMTFTGGFDGDLDIYRADLDGKNIKRLTTEFGYDGGPFVSWSGKKIVYRRAPAFKTPAEQKAYMELWKKNMVRPSKMELWVMNSDGTGKRQITNLGGANFAPFIHPDEKTVVFCSNFEDPKGREFDIYTIGLDGKNLKKITQSPDFDGFPMFSKDGKHIVWASNRGGKVRGETNIFVADYTP